MRRTLLLTLISLGVASCGPKTVTLADGNCEKVSVGDHVNGVAVLHSYAGLGCVECGAYLTRNGCDGMIGFRTGTEEVDHAYDAITARRKGDVNGEPVTRRVLVAGPVIANGATGKPLLNADKLASAE